MVQYSQKYVRGSPGLREDKLSLDSGLRNKRFSFVTTGFLSTHVAAPAANVGGTWRCVRQSDAPDTMVMGGPWVTFGSASVPGAVTTGWRMGRLPFPSTLCVSMYIAALNPGLRVKFLAKGLDQFGRPMTEESPWVPLYDQDLTLHGFPAVPADIHVPRIFMSRVFSEVTSFSYRLDGVAPASIQVNVGQHFTFDSHRVSAHAAAAGGLVTLEQFYFPHNQGIGTGMLLSQERGLPTARYPEIRAMVWNGTAGPGNVAQLMPHTTPGLSTGAGIYMGFTGVEHYYKHPLMPNGTSLDQELLTFLALGGSGVNLGPGVRYSEWEADPFKFRVDSIPSIAGSAFTVKSLAETDFFFYDNSDPLSGGGAGKYLNPKTLYWSVEVSTLIGGPGPRINTSDRVNS